MDEARQSNELETAGGFRVGNLHVLPATGEISGPGGREQVDPKVMTVLVRLARTPRALVTRAQLLQEIWPGGNVYDDALTQCIYQLRQHLVVAGGADECRELVQTLPKRGYLLAADVAVTVPAGRFRLRWASVIGVVVLAVAIGLAVTVRWPHSGPPGAGQAGASQTPPPEAAPNSIAVLPFDSDRVGDGENYLSEGISDELRDRLAGVGDWRVVARRSSVRLRESPENVQTLGRLLGVRRIVDGRIERDEDRIRVTVELVDATTGFRLWSRRYERPIRNLLQMEQELARDLMLQLSPLLVSAAEPAPPTVQQEAAHDLLLLGRQYEREVMEQQRVDEPRLERAIELFGRAIELDPDSAEAHARLGRLLLYAGEVARAEPHILQAIELDSGRAETFTTLGLYYWLVREEGSGAAYRRALELNPHDADALSYFAAWSWLQGNARDAVEYYRRAQQVDPLSMVRYADLGYKLAFEGSRAEALSVEMRLLELFPTAAGYLAAARIREALGEPDEAIAWCLRALQFSPGDPEATGLLTELLARLGDYDAARRYDPDPGLGQLFWEGRYAELVAYAENVQGVEPVQPEARFLTAFAYSALGDPMSAVAELEEAGLPETALSESRRANELHAMLIYIGALEAAGRVDEAAVAAEWVLNFNQSLLPSEGVAGWLPRLAVSCALSVLNREPEALAWIQTLPEVSTLTWLPWLRDLTCFDDLRDEMAYRDTVADLEARIDSFRSGLERTLNRDGLSLDRPKRVDASESRAE